jgi:glycosyltransferase involved in cell wall biosynthesis
VWDSVKNKYIGKVVALNAGIKAAYGKYILPLDADDMMKTDRIERMYRAIVNNPHHFIYDNLQFFANGEIIPYTYPEYIITINSDGTAYRELSPKFGETTLYPKLGDYDFDTLIYKNHVHNSIMFPREAGLYPERFKYGREDWAMAVKLGVNGYCGIRLKDYNGLLYRREGQNRTLENTKPDWVRYFQKQMVEEFKDIYKGSRPMGCCGRGAGQTSRNQAFANRASVNNIGADGFTRVRYIGGKVGAFTTWGFATGTQYRISPKETRLIDNRDLMDNTKQHRGILQKQEGNKPMFVVVEENEVKINELAQPTDELVAEIVQEFQEETLDLINNLDIPSILGSNITVFNREMKKREYSESELTILLAYERANKNRMGVVDRLEELLNPVNDDTV